MLIVNCSCYWLSVNLDDTVRKASKEPLPRIGPRSDIISSMEEHYAERKERVLMHHSVMDESRYGKKYVTLSPPKRPTKETFEDSSSDSDNVQTNKVSIPATETTLKSVETHSRALPASSDSFVDAPVDSSLPVEVAATNLTELDRKICKLPFFLMMLFSFGFCSKNYISLSIKKKKESHLVLAFQVGFEPLFSVSL